MMVISAAMFEATDEEEKAVAAAELQREYDEHLSRWNMDFRAWHREARNANKIGLGR